MPLVEEYILKQWLTRAHHCPTLSSSLLGLVTSTVLLVTFLAVTFKRAAFFIYCCLCILCCLLLPPLNTLYRLLWLAFPHITIIKTK